MQSINQLIIEEPVTTTGLLVLYVSKHRSKNSCLASLTPYNCYITLLHCSMLFSFLHYAHVGSTRNCLDSVQKPNNPILLSFCIF